MNFLNLDINLKYKSLNEDLIEIFYKPVFHNTKTYKRAVAYFSSDSLFLLLKALRNFVIDNEGKIQLIISPFLSENDLDVLKELNQEINPYINKVFKDLLNSEFLSLTSRQLFIALLKSQVLEIKIAIPDNSLGIFHEKIGIFYDFCGNKIAISGSNNQTVNATKYNHESFNTFCSWKNGQNEYVKQHEKDFDNYWENFEKNLKVYDVNKALSENLLKKYDTTKSIRELFEDFLKKENTKTLNFDPYEHQIIGNKLWMKNKKGILKYATGAGKTKAAILILSELEKIEKKLFTIIVVPDKNLVVQWSEELKENKYTSIKCYSENQNWIKELKDEINIYSFSDEYNNVIVVSADTFFGVKFKSELSKIKSEYFLIVDECHSWGTEYRLANLPNPNFILGLSATPEINFSETKTLKLLRFFGGIVHEFTLETAIKKGFLVGYDYVPIEVKLNENEKAQYGEITKKIVSLFGKDISEISDKYDKILETLLFKRARIVYGAASKLEYLEKNISDFIKEGNLLIYAGPTSYSEDDVDDIQKSATTQLQAVNQILSSKGLRYAKYTSEENQSQREFALKAFQNNTYQILTAIKCLDEGIDIPQVTKAIILASSTNPREFIQRRGRVLRKHPKKTKATIYDFIVSNEEYDSLISKEIKRVYEFSNIANNKKELFEKYNNLFIKFIYKGETHE